MTATVDDADARPALVRPAPWAGLSAILGGLFALACLSVGPRLGIGFHAYDDSVYTMSQWLLAAALIVSGIVAAVATRIASSCALAAACVFAAQLAAAGMVAYRHWIPWSGMTGASLRHPGLLRGIGAALAVACLLAVVGCLLGLIARRVFERAATTPVVRIATVAIGLVVIGLTPLALAGGQADRLDWESQGAFSLLYGVPWGIAIAVSAWLARPAAWGAHAAVAASAVVASQTHAMMPIADQSLGFAFAALAAVSAAVTRYSDHAK
jgi:hypothetical protein